MTASDKTFRRIAIIGSVVACVAIEFEILRRYHAKSIPTGGRINLSVGMIHLTFWNAIALALIWEIARRKPTEDDLPPTRANSVLRGIVITAYLGVLILLTGGIVFALS